MASRIGLLGPLLILALAGGACVGTADQVAGVTEVTEVTEPSAAVATTAPLAPATPAPVGAATGSEATDDLADSEGSTDEGSTDEGSTDEGSTDEGSTDEGSTDATDEAAVPGCAEGDRVDASVSGVQDWVRLRADASLSGPEIRQLPLGTTVGAWPDSLTYDGSEFWWLAVHDSETGECGWVAARYLDGPTGRLDRLLQAISFELPAEIDPVRVRSDPVTVSWGFDNGVYTSMSIAIRPGENIDGFIAQQQADLDYLVSSGQADYLTMPTEWFETIEVPGADRAVIPYRVPSDTGDGIDRTILVQVHDTMIEFGTYLYIADLTKGFEESLDVFRNSIAVADPSAFGPASD